jgi:hypothetical protein
VGGARWPGSGGGTSELGWLEVGDGTDIWGPVDRETWERRRASGLAGPEAEWAARSDGPKSRNRISELKIRFLNLPML